MGGGASKEREAKEREEKDRRAKERQDNDREAKERAARELLVHREKLEVLAQAQKERELKERILKQIADVKREEMKLQAQIVKERINVQAGEMKLQAEIEKERIKANQFIEKEKIGGQVTAYGMNRSIRNFIIQKFSLGNGQIGLYGIFCLKMIII